MTVLFLSFFLMACDGTWQDDYINDDGDLIYPWEDYEE